MSDPSSKPTHSEKPSEESSQPNDNTSQGTDADSDSQSSALDLALTRRRLSMMADDTQEPDALDGSRDNLLGMTNQAEIIRQVLELHEASLRENASAHHEECDVDHHTDASDEELDSSGPVDESSPADATTADPLEQQRVKPHKEAAQDRESSRASAKEANTLAMPDPSQQKTADDETKYEEFASANPSSQCEGDVKQSSSRGKTTETSSRSVDQSHPATDARQQRQMDQLQHNQKHQQAKHQHKSHKQQQQQQHHHHKDRSKSGKGDTDSTSPQEATTQKDKTQPLSVIIDSFYSLSRVGFVPYNSSKVNQDRACETYPFGSGQYHRGFFGVFDGHGQFGHHVSQFCATNLPKLLARQHQLFYQPSFRDESLQHRVIAECLHHAFITCNDALITGKLETNFSGSTAISLFIEQDTLYCANAGDSRAVLGHIVDRPMPDGTVKREYGSIDLSLDHKPCREDERKRILAHKGRVEACRDVEHRPIGPLRVWLRHQDVPGLAMTRSFGDRVAASVGVCHVPEITTHKFIPGVDKFVILASDGVWEFISSREAVQLVSQYKTPEEACKALYLEADRRWRTEEEVVDDITVLIIFFKEEAEELRPPSTVS